MTWQAIVVACYLANPSLCVELEDQSWYPTQEKCQVRAFKMAEDVHKYMKTHKAKSWRCRPMPKGKLTQ
jgi:hypothetical protein